MRKQEDFEAEIRAHIALAAEDLRAEGMSDEAALLEARRRFGNVSAAQDRHADARVNAFLDSLRRDFQFALRGLRRTGSLTAVMIAVLALGLAGTMTIF